MSKMKRNKTARANDVVIAMQTALDDFGTDPFTEVINKINNCGKILEVVSRSIFITLPKKPGVNE